MEIRSDFLEEVALELRKNNRSPQALGEKALLWPNPGDREAETVQSQLTTWKVETG